MGGATDRATVNPSGPSSPPVGETVAESGPDHTTAVAGLWVGALAAGCLGRAGGHPVAAWLDGQCALQPPAPACNAAPATLFRPVSRACTGGIFALKSGSCSTSDGVRCSRERTSVCLGRLGNASFGTRISFLRDFPVDDGWTLRTARVQGKQGHRSCEQTFLKTPQNRNLVSIQDAAHVMAWASPSPCLQPWMTQPLLTR